MVTIKTNEEIKILKEGGKISAYIMEEISQKALPGVSAFELNELAEKLIERYKAQSSFKNYRPRGSRYGYPFSLCVSLNDEVVHGLALKDKILKEGDIASFDLGIRYKGLYTDMAITVGVGKIGEKEQRLIGTTKRALEIAIETIKEGITLGDLGFALQRYVESQGFSVVKKLVGHGVGYKVHEEPEVPNYGEPGRGLTLKEGMVLALEPMVNEGTEEVVLSDDNWTWKTKDGSLSAHFEHTIVVTRNGAEILTKI